MSSFKQRRGGYKAAVTKYTNEVNDLLLDEVNEIDKLKLKSYMVKLKNQQCRIQELDSKIQSEITDTSQLNDEISEAEEVDFDIIQTIIKIEDVLKSTDDPSNYTGKKSTGIKLPPLNLSTFDGNVMKWPAFNDDFVTVIHKNRDLDDARKLAYLKGQLRGEALKLIGDFALTNDNYAEAYELLETTYGKSDRIVVQHLHALFDLKSPSLDVKSMSNFRSEFESHLRGLSAMQMDTINSGYIYSTMLLRKLPAKIQENLNRSNDAMIWDLGEFRNAVSKEIELLQQIDSKVSIFHKSSEANNFQATASNFAMTKDTVKKVNSRSCQFCQDNHSPVHCEKYKSVKDRLEQAKLLRLCLNCLRGNHMMRECKSPSRCFRCNMTHHSALCYKLEGSQRLVESDGKKNEAIEKKKGNTDDQVVINCVAGAGKSVSLPFAEVSIMKTKAVTVFDMCSQATCIRKTTVERLKLQTFASKNIALQSFDSRRSSGNKRVVQLRISSPCARYQENILALVVDKLSDVIIMPGLVNTATYLKKEGADIPDCLRRSDAIENVEILIGADYYYKFIFGERVLKGVHLLQSWFGELISGPLPCPDCDLKDFSCSLVIADQSSFTVSKRENAKFSGQLSCLWELDPMQYQEENNEDPVLKMFLQSIRYEDNKYVVRLPWKLNHKPIPSNYALARSRLTSMLQKLRNDPENLKKYEAVIQDQVKKKFIEAVKINTQSGDNNNIHYLAHHPIYKNSATTPLRVVFDCSAGSVSLNDCLYSGPSLVNDLTKILLRFRLNAFASVSDISKAFLMVGLDERDRDVTRFLWPKNPQDPLSPIQVYRFRVVLFGATCSQFLLNSTIIHHLSQSDSQMARDIARNLYIDNLQLTAENEDSMVDKYKQSTKIMKTAGMELREWYSNSALITEMTKHDNSKQSHTIGVLGMNWNTTTDELNYPTKKLLSELKTKRSVLKHTASVFDPLGFISPIMIRSKILLQELWKTKCGWDDVMDEVLSKLWILLVEDLNIVLDAVKIRRTMLFETNDSVELHGFCDSSERAYGAVIYLRTNEYVSFVASRAKVAPIKKITIPRLELLAALLNARLMKHVIDAISKEVKIKGAIMWSDSQIVLSWLKSNKKLDTFIANRIVEIKESLPDDTEWRYVASKENPSDIITRGTTAERFLNSNWFSGPIWLISKNKWPKEMKCNTENVQISIVATVPIYPDDVREFIELEKFGSYIKLLRVVALLYYVADMTRLKEKNEESERFSVERLERAESFLIKYVQHKHYLEEVNLIRNHKKNNLIKQLRLFLDDQGVIRIGGRFENTDFSEETKYPILLPHNSHLTKLLINDYHRRKHHGGVSYLIAQLREKFWITKARQIVKSTLRGCVTCKRLQGLSYKIPVPGQLPRDRVLQDKPFQVTGIDFTGHLLVKERNKTSKVYIALFTCGLTRAIHLELVEDLSSESFIRAFRRFAGRRSCPRTVYSDNASTFVSSSTYLKKIKEHPEVKELGQEKRFVWKTIPTRAAWYGGFWEKLIGLTKNAIKKTLGRAFISIDEMRTLLVEIEASLNDRPLTYTTSDPLDLASLTPSMLIYGFRITEFPEVTEDPNEAHLERSFVSRRYKKILLMKESFWQRWKREYLTELREKHIQQMKSRKTGGIKEIELGDIVIIHEDNKPRLYWRLGLVEELVVGTDGCVRSARIRTSHGQIHRPIAKLFPLEITSRITEVTPKRYTENDVTQVRTQRIAAAVAGGRIQEQLNLEQVSDDDIVGANM